MERRFILPVLMAALGAVHAQTPTAAPPAFDVASIKPSVTDSVQASQFRLGHGVFASPRSRLDHLIQQAYEVKYYQLVGGPPWMLSEFYDVQAKAAEDADAQQIRAMLRTLLADRFHLKLHRETRTMAGYTLNVDKNGAKLPAPLTDVPPESEGVIQMGGGLWSRGATLKHVALGLTLTLGQPVVDETRIEGHYDFRLRFEDGDDAEAVGSVLTALHEIGLKLTPGKVPVEVLVIDSADRPSAN